MAEVMVPVKADILPAGVPKDKKPDLVINHRVPVLKAVKCLYPAGSLS
jgi:hypothetical protein